MTQFARLRWVFDQEHLARRIIEYDRIMRHWRNLLTRFFPDQWIETEYEALVQDPEMHSRKLIDFLGLEWSENCLAHHKQNTQVRTASVSQVRRPIYQQSVQRWKRYEKPLAPLFDQLYAAGLFSA